MGYIFIYLGLLHKIYTVTGYGILDTVLYILYRIGIIVKTFNTLKY